MTGQQVRGPRGPYQSKRSEPGRTYVAGIAAEHPRVEEFLENAADATDLPAFLKPYQEPSFKPNTGSEVADRAIKTIAGIMGRREVERVRRGNLSEGLPTYFFNVAAFDGGDAREWCGLTMMFGTERAARNTNIGAVDAGGSFLCVYEDGGVKSALPPGGGVPGRFVQFTPAG